MVQRLPVHVVLGLRSSDSADEAVTRTRDPFHRAIEAHWREHRPRMVADLEASGRLYDAIEYAAERTVDVESALIRNGMPAMQAQELMREEWAFLPAEEDVPHLPNGGPNAWLFPAAPFRTSDPDE